MKKPLIRVAVTGAAGQIAYNLLFRIGSGELFGQDQPIALHLLEVEEAVNSLKGVCMELEDCAFPLLREIHHGSSAHEVFKGVHYALLVGAKPRGPGMERKDLLTDNGKIFVEQGAALNDVADPNVKVFVIGNPCNTNCLIALTNAPKIPRQNFFAMTQLDQNRAQALIAKKARVEVETVSHVTIWGNHSSTQVPDFFNAKVGKRAVTEVISDHHWLEEEFISTVQKRGAAIIAARGKSSAASAANAIIDAVKAQLTQTKEGDWFSSAVHAEGNPYGIDENLVFSFPCRINQKREVEIVPGLPLNDFLTKKIKLSEQELIEERELVSALLSAHIA